MSSGGRHVYPCSGKYTYKTFFGLQVLRVLVGNKIDRDDHEIPPSVGEEFASRHNMYFLQVSTARRHLPVSPESVG